jgi:hypothetical protein
MVSDIMSANIQGTAISTILALAVCLVVAGDVSGWSNGGYSADPDNPDYGTHDWVANAALQPQTKDVTFLKTTYNSLFLLGTEAPDNPSYIGDTGSHHFYYRSDKSIQDDVCADRASSIYSSALQYLKSNDFDLAAFEVGVMAHYISDVGVFGHTMSASTDWGPRFTIQTTRTDSNPDSDPYQLPPRRLETSAPTTRRQDWRIRLLSEAGRSNRTPGWTRITTG